MGHQSNKDIGFNWFRNSCRIYLREMSIYLRDMVEMDVVVRKGIDTSTLQTLFSHRFELRWYIMK